jgi:hypothetical protein
VTEFIRRPGAGEGSAEPVPALAPAPGTSRGPHLPGPDDPSSAAEDRLEADVEGGTPPTSLGKRFFRPQTLISFAIALGIAVFFFLRLDIDPQQVWANVRETNPFIYALAFAVFYGGFIIRAIRWRSMLSRVGIDERHGYRMPTMPRFLEIYLISWFANCIVPAKLGDAVRSYLFKQDTRAPFSSTLGTILTERLIDLIALFLAMVTAAIIVFGTHLPGQASNAVIGGVALLGVGAVGLAVLWLMRDRVEQMLPERLREQYTRLHGAIFASLRRPERFLGIGFVIWVSEGLRLWFVCIALGADITFAMAIFVALMASLLTALPFTPAGLGVVEGGMTVILTSTVIGVAPDMALAITLLDRVIGYWSIIAVGLVLYLLRIRREISQTARVDGSVATNRPVDQAGPAD